MVKTHQSSKFVLLNLSDIRNTDKIILQIDDTHTNFTDGQKCYLCEVVDKFIYNVIKSKDDLIMEICRLNDEKRKLEKKVAKLEKALNALNKQNLKNNMLYEAAIVPPCKVGDTVWFLLEDDFPVHKWFLSEEKITEVASKGFFTSSFAEPCGTEDLGNYTAYSEVGKEAFFNKPEAEAKLKEMDKLAGKSNMGSTCE